MLKSNILLDEIKERKKILSCRGINKPTSSYCFLKKQNISQVFQRFHRIKMNLICYMGCDTSRIKRSTDPKIQVIKI